MHGLFTWISLFGSPWFNLNKLLSTLPFVVCWVQFFFFSLRFFWPRKPNLLCHSWLMKVNERRNKKLKPKKTMKSSYFNFCQPFIRNKIFNFRLRLWSLFFINQPTFFQLAILFHFICVAFCKRYTFRLWKKC